MRRAKGEGSIIRLKNGRWQARVRKGGKTKTRNASTKSEAVKLLTILKQEEETPQDALTAVLRGFYDARKGRYSPATEKRLKSTINTYLVPRVEEAGWDGVNTEWLEEIAQTKSPSTVKKIHDAAVMVARWGGVSISLDIPRQKDTPGLQVYTRDEIAKIKTEALRTNADGEYIHRYGVALMILLCTGLRAGELCALRWEDVTEGELYVHATYADGKIQAHPKSSASIRRVPVNKQARELLQQAREIYGGEYVITTGEGRVVDPIKLAKKFDKVLTNAGVRKIKGKACHALRDAFATYLFDAGADLLTVARILGHSSVKVTERYYVYVTAEKKRAAVDMLDF